MARFLTWKVVLLWTALGISQSICAQPGGRPVVVSPEVNADNSVVFRFLSQTAKEVKLSTQIEKSQVPMTKDSSGIWSVKIGPVKPDIYPYHFVVDGTSVADPRNSATFPNEGFQSSLVEITGATPLVHTRQNVPHGTVSYRYIIPLNSVSGLWSFIRLRVMKRIQKTDTRCSTCFTEQPILKKHGRKWAEPTLFWTT